MLCDRCRGEIRREPTEREIQVVTLLAHGYVAKEVATKLGIEYRTVKAHKYNIMKRIGLRTTGQLVAWLIATDHLTAQAVLDGVRHAAN